MHINEDYHFDMITRAVKVVDYLWIAGILNSVFIETMNELLKKKVISRMVKQ